MRTVARARDLPGHGARSHVPRRAGGAVAGDLRPRRCDPRRERNSRAREVYQRGATWLERSCIRWRHRAAAGADSRRGTRRSVRGASGVAATGARRSAPVAWPGGCLAVAFRAVSLATSADGTAGWPRGAAGPVDHGVSPWRAGHAAPLACRRSHPDGRCPSREACYTVLFGSTGTRIGSAVLAGGARRPRARVGPWGWPRHRGTVPARSAGVDLVPV